MKRILFLSFFFILFSSFTHSINIPPKEFFIGQDGAPNVLLVTGEEASSQDIVSSSILAARIGQMAMRAEARTYSKSDKVKMYSYAFSPSAVSVNPYLDDAAAYNLDPLYFHFPLTPDPYRYNEIVITPERLSTLHYFDESFVDYHGNEDGRFQYFETHEEIMLRFYDAIYFHKWSGVYVQDHILDLFGGDFLGEFEAPSVPVLASPLNGATGVCPQTNLPFNWADSTGTYPIAYQIQLSTTNTFITTVFDQTGLSTSNFVYTGTLPALTTYYWHVRAVNDYGTSSWSQVWSFATGTCALPGPTPPPLPPPLIFSSAIPPPPGRIYPSVTYRVVPIYEPRYVLASSRSIDLEGTSSEFYAIPDPDLITRGMKPDRRILGPVSELKPVGVLPKIYFFDRIYEVIDVGEAFKSVVKGEYDTTVRSNYLVYGVPYYYIEQYLRLGETKYYNNYAITLLEVDLDHNKARISITDPALFPDTFWMVLNPRHGFSPDLQEEGFEGIGGEMVQTGECLHDVFALTSADIVQEDEQFYTIAGMDISGRNNVVVYLLLDGIAVFHGKDYNGIMFNLYVLEDWGRFYDMRCCFPYIERPNRYSLDIFEAGNIKFPDQPAGEEGVYVWGMDVGICDDMPSACPYPFFIYGPSDYFKISFEDVKFEEEDYDDVEFWVEKSLPIQTIYTTERVNFLPQSMIRLDSEVTEEDERKSNLILIGGPVSNRVTFWLVSNGLSRTDWFSSDGDWELIKDPFGAGHDVLIVAGRDRHTTRIAAIELARRLNLLP